MRELFAVCFIQKFIGRQALVVRVSEHPSFHSSGRVERALSRSYYNKPLALRRVVTGFEDPISPIRIFPRSARTADAERCRVFVKRIAVMAVKEIVTYLGQRVGA